MTYFLVRDQKSPKQHCVKDRRIKTQPSTKLLNLLSSVAVHKNFTRPHLLVITRAESLVILCLHWEKNAEKRGTESLSYSLDVWEDCWRWRNSRLRDPNIPHKRKFNHKASIPDQWTQSPITWVSVFSELSVGEKFCFQILDRRPQAFNRFNTLLFQVMNMNLQMCEPDQPSHRLGARHVRHKKEKARDHCLHRQYPSVKTCQHQTSEHLSAALTTRD